MASYIVEYFPIDGLVWPTRALLSFAGVEYKNVFPDWPTESTKTPFGHLPVLTEIYPDGTKFVLAESGAIELYLAEKYIFLPKDSFGLEDQSLNCFTTEQTPTIAKLITMAEENTSIKKAFI
ncbi:hypothetical protein BB560_002840 [Smittium megazygosporum]|uniref:GST N-terminal domain-containing protein n=1 Tax=Smittium megazygosporum TaxID=133381 RepID=A0A2T9ZDN3_9FUNG|nr:hypothetical protein BB560_002840 [Smittium megazygosporum]